MNNQMNNTMEIQLNLEFDDGYFVSAKNGNEFLYFTSRNLLALSKQSPALQQFLSKCFEDMVVGKFGDTDGEELMLNKANYAEDKAVISSYATNLVPEGAVVCYMQEPSDGDYAIPRDYAVMLPSEYKVWQLF